MELEKREQNRTDHENGLARWQYDQIHKYMTYDIIIDTNSLATDDYVRTIIQKIDSNYKDKAFENLQQKYKTQLFNTS